MTQPLVIIPARLDSARLPNKMLADLGGAPLIVRTWQAAVAAKVGPVAVACANPELVEAIEQAGGVAVLTDAALPSGSDRVWAAAQSLDKQGAHPWIINLQGDTPFFPSQHLRQLVASLDQATTEIVTLCAPLQDEQINDSAVVKAAVVFAEADAKNTPQVVPYFSRSPVPWHRETGKRETGQRETGGYQGHIGVYAWRREALGRFVSLPQTALEKREGLEQLRALEAGMQISAIAVDSFPQAVDTEQDLENARKTARALLG